MSRGWDKKLYFTKEITQFQSDYKNLHRHSLRLVPRLWYWLWTSCVVFMVHKKESLTSEWFPQTGVPKMAAWLTASWRERIMSRWGRLACGCGGKLAEVSCQMLNNTHNQAEQREVSIQQTGSCWIGLQQQQQREHQSDQQSKGECCDHHLIFSQRSKLRDKQLLLYNERCVKGGTELSVNSVETCGHVLTFSWSAD